jgi:hypothetical protein
MEQLGRQSKILYSFVNDSIASSYFYNMNEAEKTLYKSVNIHAINHQRTVFLNLVLPADSTSHYLLNILLGLTLGHLGLIHNFGATSLSRKRNYTSYSISRPDFI